jgi:hypothetical protein
MAYPPPQGNYYQPNYGQDPYPPPNIGFQNFVAVNPNAQPRQHVPYPPTTVAYHGTPEPRPEPQHRPRSTENPANDVPVVGFEQFTNRPKQPFAQSASGVELENVEDLPHDYPEEEQLSDNSRSEVSILLLYFVKYFKSCFLLNCLSHNTNVWGILNGKSGYLCNENHVKIAKVDFIIYSLFTIIPLHNPDKTYNP